MGIPQICPECHSNDLKDLMKEMPVLFQGHNFGWEYTVECKSCDCTFFTVDERMRSFQVRSAMKKYAREYPDKNVMEYLVELFVEKTSTNYKRGIILNMTDLKELLKLKLFAAPEFYPYFTAQILYLQQTNPVLYEIETSIDHVIPRLEDLNGDNFGYFAENGQIKGLKLSHMQIQFFPYQILKLPNLQHLELSNLSMEYYDSELGLQSIPLRNISEDIGRLKRLSYLNLEQNGLKILPKSLSTLKNLTILHLACNELRELPEEIGNLSNLVELTIHKNKLTDLPTSFEDLVNLRSLYLDRQLYEYPHVRQLVEILIEKRKEHDREFQLHII